MLYVRFVLTVRTAWSAGSQHWEVSCCARRRGQSLSSCISGQQHELLDWLKEVTFPMEARFADLNFARTAYETAVRRIINCGVSTLSAEQIRHSR